MTDQNKDAVIELLVEHLQSLHDAILDIHGFRVPDHVEAELVRTEDLLAKTKRNR